MTVPSVPPQPPQLERRSHLHSVAASMPAVAGSMPDLHSVAASMPALAASMPAMMMPRLTQDSVATSVAASVAAMMVPLMTQPLGHDMPPRGLAAEDNLVEEAGLRRQRFRAKSWDKGCTGVYMTGLKGSVIRRGVFRMCVF